MNFNNLIQNTYVQAVAAIFAFSFLIWLVTDTDSSAEVATSDSTLEVINEVHEVSAEFNDEPMEIIVEGKVPTSNNDNVEENNNAGGI